VVESAETLLHGVIGCDKKHSHLPVRNKHERAGQPVPKNGSRIRAHPALAKLGDRNRENDNQGELCNPALPSPFELPEWSSNRQQADRDDLNPFRVSQNAAPGVVNTYGASLSLQACQSCDAAHSI
jgi:hypothetical protein